MVRIDLKIKTIEGADNEVSVDNKMLLSQFRDVVYEATSIDKDSQRLIFRGRVLLDEDKTLESYGLETGYAIHVVNRPLPPPTSSQRGGQRTNNQRPIHPMVGNQGTIRHQNLIIGTVPIERTPGRLFEDPQRILAMVREQLDQQLAATFHINSDVALTENRPSEGDFSIDALLEGRREALISPAREKFRHCAGELKRLAWMLATVKALFHRHIDSLLAGNAEPRQREAYETIAFILRGMRALDNRDEEQLRANILYANGIGAVEPLLETIEQLNAWRPTDDGAHVEEMDGNVGMGHCTTADYAEMLDFLAAVDAEFNQQLMPRYSRVLHLPSDHDASSYTARLLNCYSMAIARIQHRRAHLLHVLSDLTVQFDSNPHGRLYPQYIAFEREEPPRANINFAFYRHDTPQGGMHSTLGHPANPPPFGSASGNSRNSHTAAATQQRSEMGTPVIAQIPLSLAQARDPRVAGSRQRSATPGLSRSDGRPIQIARRRVPPMAGVQPGLVGWRQLPPESSAAIFVGPRPPVTVPISTSEVYLPCTSRHLASFELDSSQGHTDFWNDPVTVAAGIQPREGSGSREVPRESATRNPLESANQPLRIQLNDNGEAVFGEEQELVAYIRHVVGSVLASMADVQPRLLAEQRAPPSSTAYGFAPIIRGPSTPPFMLMGGASGLQPLIEGTISIIAEIPMSMPRPPQPPERGAQRGPPPNQMEEPPFD